MDINKIFLLGKSIDGGRMNINRLLDQRPKLERLVANLFIEKAWSGQVLGAGNLIKDIDDFDAFGNGPYSGELLLAVKIYDHLNEIGAPQDVERFIFNFPLPKYEGEEPHIYLPEDLGMKVSYENNCLVGPEDIMHLRFYAMRFLHKSGIVETMDEGDEDDRLFLTNFQTIFSIDGADKEEYAQIANDVLDHYLFPVEVIVADGTAVVSIVNRESHVPPVITGVFGYLASDLHRSYIEAKDMAHYQLRSKKHPLHKYEVDPGHDMLIFH